MFALSAVHLKFNFLRSHRDFATRPRPKRACHWAKVPSSSDNQSRCNLRIHQPGIARPLHRLERRTLKDSRPATLKQKCVKFAPPNSIADRMPVLRRDFPPANPASTKSSNRLQHSSAAIFVKIDLQFFNNRRRDPPAANFIPRKSSPIENRDVQTRPPQSPSARRPRRPPANNQDIARIHRGSFSAAASSCS